jgi:hypothetical protein
MRSQALAKDSLHVTQCSHDEDDDAEDEDAVGSEPHDEPERERAFVKSVRGDDEIDRLLLIVLIQRIIFELRS